MWNDNDHMHKSTVWVHFEELPSWIECPLNLMWKLFKKKTLAPNQLCSTMLFGYGSGDYGRFDIKSD